MISAVTPDAELLPAVIESVLALPTLPADEPGDRYGLRTLTATWLVSQRSPKTRKAYFGDLSLYLGWCDADDLDPTQAYHADLMRYRAWLTGSPATVRRRLAALSSWYKVLLINRKVDHNPLDGVTRPAVNRDESSAASLDVAEMKVLLLTADRLAVASQAHGRWRTLIAYRDRAVLRLLADLGPRRAEICTLDLADLSTNRGHRTLRYVGKGSKQRERPIPAHAIEALDEYLEIRGDTPGPLFVTLNGGRGEYGRIDPKHGVWEVVRKIARLAGLPQAERLGAHSLRHSFATNALDHGVPLAFVQDAMGHADPRTTRIYDRARNKLKNDPALILGGLYATD